MKVFSINLSKITDEQMETLEGSIIEESFQNSTYEIDEELKTLSFIKVLYGNTTITFHSFLEEGKFIKAFLLSSGLISDMKDNSLFSLKEVENLTLIKASTSIQLDSKLYVVTEKDPHLAAVLRRLKEIKK